MRQRLPMWGMWALAARKLSGAPSARIPSGASAATSIVLTAAALAALVTWSFWQRWSVLAASPFPLGVDGYFYPLQLRSLLEHGRLAYPTSPLAFYLLAPLAACTDPITGTKLGAALYGAAIAIPAYGLGARLGRGRGAGLLAAALATTSTGSMYLTVEFVKNAIGLTVALAALWLVLRAADHASRSRVGLALAGSAAAWTTHKMAGALVLLIGVPAVLAALHARGALRTRRGRIALAALAALAGLTIGLGAAFPQRLLSTNDVARIGDLLATTPHWTDPALALPTGDLALGHDALLGLALGVTAVAARLIRRRTTAPASSSAPATSAPASIAAPATSAPASCSAPTILRATPAGASASTAASWSIVVLAIAIGLPLLAITDRQGLGFRLRLAAFVPAALTAAIVAGELLRRYARRELALAVLAAALVVVRRPSDDLDAGIVTHPALVTAAQALNGRVPPGTTLIIPERHIAFLVAWYTGASIALRPEAIAPEHRLRLLPLHFIGANSPLDRQLTAARAEPSLPPPIGVHPRHPNGLVLVPEPTWTWVLDHLPPADRARFAAWPTI